MGLHLDAVGGAGRWTWRDIIVTVGLKKPKHNADTVPGRNGFLITPNVAPVLGGLPSTPSHHPTLARDTPSRERPAHIVQVIPGTEFSLSFNTSCRHHITYVPEP